MFWYALTIAFFAGLISNNLFRNQLKKIFRNYDEFHFDAILIALLIVSSTFTAFEHFQSINENLELKNRIEELTPKLSVVDHIIQRNEKGYSAYLKLESNRKEPIGQVEFEINLPIETPAEILDVWPTKYGSQFVYYENSLRVSKDKKNAILAVNFLGNKPSIQINVSGPTKIYLKEKNFLPVYNIEINEDINYPQGTSERKISKGKLTF